MSRLHDLMGERFGKLRVIDRADNASDGHAQWVCECRCGNVVIITSQSLVCGKTNSCGCLRKKIARMEWRTSVC